MTNWNDRTTPKPPSMATRGRLGGLTTSSKHNMDDCAARARQGLLRRFEDEVDPERMLTEEERARRVEAARKLYYGKLALRSAAVRRGRAAGKGGEK